MANKTNLLLITSTLAGKDKDGANVTVDGQDHIAQRIYPFPAVRDGMSVDEAVKAIGQWAKDLSTCVASGQIEGTLVTDPITGAGQDVKVPLKTPPFGTGSTVDGSAILTTIDRSFRLIHQAEMNKVLRDKYVAPKTVAARTAKAGKTFDPQSLA